MTDVEQLLRMILIALLSGVAAGICVWVTGDVVQRFRVIRAAKEEARRLQEEAEAARVAAEDGGGISS